jgi:hypothetical protein
MHRREQVCVADVSAAVRDDDDALACSRHLVLGRRFLRQDPRIARLTKCAAIRRGLVPGEQLGSRAAV